MKDFDYDVLQKKRIARGAYAKKNGSRSKRCTMPDDYLTNAERKKLSRTVVDVNLKKPMDWETFKSLPTEIKREYLEYLRDECGATASNISLDMFGKSKSALRMYIRNDEPSLEGIFKKGGLSNSALKERSEKWEAFLNQEPESREGMYFRTYRIEQTTERPGEVSVKEPLPEQKESDQNLPCPVAIMKPPKEAVDSAKEWADAELKRIEETKAAIQKLKAEPVRIIPTPAVEKESAKGLQISSITFTINDCTVDDLRRLFESLEG